MSAGAETKREASREKSWSPRACRGERGGPARAGLRRALTDSGESHKRSERPRARRIPVALSVRLAGCLVGGLPDRSRRNGRQGPRTGRQSGASGAGSPGRGVRGGLCWAGKKA